MILSQQAQEMVKFWENNRNIPFKERLISIDNDVPCMCAQGQTLFRNGFSIEQLQKMMQREADREVAKILDISIAHSVLLRLINDNVEGSPQDVLSNPEKYLGPNSQEVLEFWSFLDGKHEYIKYHIKAYYYPFYINSESKWKKPADEALKASDETVGCDFAEYAAHVAEYNIFGSCWESRKIFFTGVQEDSRFKLCYAYWATREIIGGVENPVFTSYLLSRF